MAVAAPSTIERPSTDPAEAGPFRLIPYETFCAIGDQVAAHLEQRALEDPAVPATHYAASVVLPHAVRVQDLEQEPTVRAEFSRGLGALSIGQPVERVSGGNEGTIIGFRDAIERAARGDTASAERNIRFSQTEALTNEGVMPDLTITLGPDGEPEQDGQKVYDILANGIQLHPGEDGNIHDITYTEAMNLYAFKEMIKSGIFRQGYVWVTATPVAVGAPGWALRKYGNFENLDVSWRFIWEESPNVFKMRVMFVAAVNPEEHEESADAAMTDAQLNKLYDDRQDRRHDLPAIRGVYQDLGMEAPETVPEFIRGFIMHRSKFSNPNHPQADMGARYDSKLGPDHYLGRRSPRGDYITDGQKYAEALEGLHADCPAILRKLVEHRHQLKDDMTAARYMAHLVREQAINYVIDHPELLPIIGTAIGLAARKVVERIHRLRKFGHEVSEDDRREVHQKARVNMCGFGDGAMDQYGSLTFQCENGHTNTRLFGELIPKCTVCDVSVKC